MKKIAITGGLASGKTSVCQFFKELGAFVISADRIVHRLLSPDTPLGLEVIELLGDEIREGETLNRARIAEKIFHDPNKLVALEALLHPAILEEIEREAVRVENEGSHALFVAEIPLLYEANMARHFAAVVAVETSIEKAKERYCIQGNQEEFEVRMKRQLNPKKKAEKADYTLSNNGSPCELKEQVNLLYTHLTN